MSRIERLKVWVNTLNEEQLKNIIVNTVDYCIDAEEVSFYDTTKVPYWSDSGERLDGSSDDNEY